MTDSTGTLAQFTAGGQRRFANRMTIDGMSADLAVDLSSPGVGEAGTGALPAFSTTGSTQTLVPLAAIGEIEVRTTNASAEHQRTPGAQTSIVTRAGGDRVNASAFMDYRPNATRGGRLVLQRIAHGAEAPRQFLERRRVHRRAGAARRAASLLFRERRASAGRAAADDDVSGAGDDCARRCCRRPRARCSMRSRSRTVEPSVPAPAPARSPWPT